jgi:hypothetical protein
MGTMKSDEEIQHLANALALREYPVVPYPIHGDDGTTEGDDNSEARQACSNALMLTLPLLFGLRDTLVRYGGTALQFETSPEAIAAREVIKRAYDLEQELLR